MKLSRIVTLALVLASAGALGVASGQDAGNAANPQNRKEESQVKSERVIMLIEAKIQPQRRAELVEAVREYLPLVRSEPGVETFYITARKDDPNTFVFYEIY